MAETDETLLKNGHLGYLTKNQQAKLEAMHKQIQTTELDDARADLEDEEYQRKLLRFLRARKFDLNDSFEMYQETMIWRQKHNIDNILVDPPTKLELSQKVIPGCHHKFDKEGRPIRIERMGELLSSRIHELFSEQEYLLIHAWDTERQLELIEESRQAGKDVDTVVYIGDMKDLTLQARNAVWLVRGISDLDALHYPERCGKVFLINCPWAFPVLYNNLVKPFLDPVVRNKISIFNDNASEALIDLIGKEDLPEEYGGDCHCEGGCIPHYSKSDVHEALASLQPANLSSTKLKGGQTFQQTFEFGHGGAAVDWFFKMEEKQDVEFSVFWNPANGEQEVIHSKTVIVFDKFGEEGEFAKNQKGSLTLEWKNRAMFFKKNLKYSIQKNEIEELSRSVRVPIPLPLVPAKSSDEETDSSGSDCNV